MQLHDGFHSSSRQKVKKIENQANFRVIMSTLNLIVKMGLVFEQVGVQTHILRSNIKVEQPMLTLWGTGINPLASLNAGELT